MIVLLKTEFTSNKIAKRSPSPNRYPGSQFSFPENYGRTKDGFLIPHPEEPKPAEIINALLCLKERLQC